MLVAGCILGCIALCLTISASLGNHQGNKCPKGQYESDFLSGGCTPCPKLSIKQCDNQQTEDAYRCRLVCGRILLTAAPISHKKTSVLKQNSTSPSHTVIPTTAQISGTKRFIEKITKVFNNTLLFPTKGHFPNKQSGQKNWTEITVGIFISVVALILLVVAICFVAYWKRCCTAGSNSDQRRQSTFYVQVSPHSRSNSDQSINDTDERVEDTYEETANVENNNGNSTAMLSVSHEDFESMTESHV